MATAQYSDHNRDLALPDDYRAIQWLQDNIDGTPTIAEGQAGLYHWGARVSIYTGLPTILGWDWHQRQQRTAYGWMIDARLRDIKTLYESPSMTEAWPILDRYAVQLHLRRRTGARLLSDCGLYKFDQAVGHGLTPVYEGRGHDDYRVDAPEQRG